MPRDIIDNRPGRVARGRATIYSMLAQSLYSPSEPLYSAVEDGTFRSFLRAALVDAPKRHRRAILPELVEKFTFRSDFGPFCMSFKLEYARLFSLDLNCPQYEADYIAFDPDNSVHVIAAVASVYSTFGMRLAENAGERLDHIAVELDFMNFLCSKEAYARDNCDVENFRLCRRAQTVFLGSHLLCWGPRFANILRAATSFWFYQGIEALLTSFLLAETRYLRVKTPSFQHGSGPKPQGCVSVASPNSNLVTISGLTKTRS